MKLRPLFLPALLGLFWGFSAQAQDLDRVLAAKLIAEANQIREAEVTVGPLQVAERKIDGNTTVIGAICVTFIAPVIQNGGRRRTIQTRTFFYDPEWGWYLFALESDRGGEVIDLVSQHKGRILLR